MTFEDRIISLTTSRYKNLKRPATLAATKPDTCVKIINKSAYYVIKDCAEITLKYLPHNVYSGIKDPVTKLKGLVTEQEIRDFAERSLKQDHTQQLLKLVLDDISRKQQIVLNKPLMNSSADDDIDFTLTGDEGDVYGDYDYVTEQEPAEETAVTDQEPVDISNLQSIVDTLLRAFC